MRSDNYYFTKAGALTLASTIQLYWAMQGLVGVNVWIEPIPDNPDQFQVRSNVVELIREHPNRNAVLQRASHRTVH